MSYPTPSGLSTDVAAVRSYINNVLVPFGVEQVWLVGSRSRRNGKVPRPDSDWDLEVMGNELKEGPIPLPADSGLHGEAQRSTSVKKGAVQLYPNWEYEE